MNKPHPSLTVSGRSPTRRERVYRCCSVPCCGNTTTKFPEKRFFSVPHEQKIRKKWCELARRKLHLSDKSQAYFCEDHFDVPEDTVNFWEHQLMGRRLRLKKNVLPHRFNCQKTDRNDDEKERSLLAKKRKKEHDELIAQLLKTPEPVKQEIIADHVLMEEENRHKNVSTYCQIKPFYRSKRIQVTTKGSMRDVAVSASLPSPKMKSYSRSPVLFDGSSEEEMYLGEDTGDAEWACQSEESIDSLSS